MKLTKRLLEAINSGVKMGLELGDEDTLRDIDFNKTIIDKSTNAASSGASACIYSKELQEMLPDPMAIDEQFIKLALDLYNKYEAQYNPHISEYFQFTKFIWKCIEIQGIKANLNWIDTSDVTSMRYVFGTPENKGYIQFNGDISKWDVSSVKDMCAMFRKSTFNGDISKWNTSNVIYMSGMFQDCKQFNQDLSNWDVSSVKEMLMMFEGCNFEGKGLENWDVSNVQNMQCMFCCCEKFNRDISKWDVSNVKDMSWMFAGSNFNSDISNWDVSNVEYKYNIFAKCPIKEEYKPKFK